MLKKEPEVKKMSLLQFRAWDKDEKVMRIVNEIHFTIKTITCEPLKGHDNMLEMYDPICFEGHFELMQSTGLKDKNGVEIFEGDILLHTSKSVNYSDTYWHSYVQAYRMDNGAYRIRGAHIYDTELMGARNHLEVVGNIYEHADLLKKDRFMTED